MIKALKKLFGKKIPVKKGNVYDIEFFPTSGRYYPRVNGYYLYCWRGGYYDLHRDVNNCVWSGDKEKAKEDIEKFKNQIGINTQIIEIE